VADLQARLAAGDPVLVRHHAWLLVDATGALAGILTRGDLLRGLQAGEGEGRPVVDFGTRELEVTYPDELLQTAVEKMAGRRVGRLPVVSRADPGRIEGYLGRTGLIEAWVQRLHEEEVRETGVVATSLRLWRRRVRRALPSTARIAS